MTSQTKSLFTKEWIKLRRVVWLLPLIVGYAVVDSLLILNTIDRNHDAMGLWVTLVTKTPPFIATFVVLMLCGWLVGFFQVWPESQGKRLRILFHTPVPPTRIISVMLATGMGIVLLTNLVALAALAGVMSLFHLPWDIMRPVLLTVIPWSLLSFATYFGIIAFFAAQTLPLRLLVVACYYGGYSLLGNSPMYGYFAKSIPQHTLFAAIFIPLVYYAFLRFQGDPSDKKYYRTTRFATLALTCLCLLGTLPTLFWRSTMPEHPRGSLFYSPIKEQFVMSRLTKTKATTSLNGQEMVYSQEDGTELTDREYFRSLPFLYSANLVKWGIFPERIQGRRIPPQQARFRWNYERITPASHNAPVPMLHMLLEAEPDGAKLEMPTDMFRVRADGMGLEFLHPENGEIDVEKSTLFTDALRGKLFEFPVTALSGNPDVRKEYDAGYFFVDSANTLFQLQMVKGKPRCVNTGFAFPTPVRGMEVSESRDREFCAYVTTDDTLYTVRLENLAVQPLPIPNYEADDTRVILFSTMVNTSAMSKSITDHAGDEVGTAMNKGLYTVHTFTRPAVARFAKQMHTRKTVESFLFPITLDQREPHSRFVHLVINGPYAYWAAAFGCLLALAAYFPMRKRTKHPIRIEDCALMLVFGPVALLTVLTADARTLFGLSNNTQ